ncbi:MAG: hypothetical protein M1835_003133 [Candelina submexicana]|nr:MAG: hypothetical protein M1835_003133 [Candelina submexicana]
MDASPFLPNSCPKRSQRSSYSGSSSPAPEAVWTASRCNRLLRPIGSRINLLRKQRKNGTTSAGLKLIDQVEVHKKLCGATQGSRGCTVEKLSLGPERRSRRTDPDWVPGSELRKKVKHKYSGRGNEDGKQLAGVSRSIRAASQSRQGSPTVSTVPTPYLSRRKGYSGDEYAKDYGDAQSRASNKPASASIRDLKRPRVHCLDNTSGTQPAAFFQRLRKLTDQSSCALIEGIVNGFDTLLKATAVTLQQDRCGPRSLLSTCLRRVPEYIAEEQERQQEDGDIDQLDISSEVYADLEEFGSLQGYGWTHLSEVVRAHGVTLLSDAIHEGILTQDTARALIQLCIHHSAHDEAELLVSSLASIQIASHQPGMASCRVPDGVSGHHSSALSTLNLFAQQTGRYGFQYRQINSLLVTGRLAVGRLASRESITLWGHVINSVSQVGEYSIDAVRLLRTVLTLACACSSPVHSDLVHEFRLYSKNNRGRYGGKASIATSRRLRSSTTLANHDERSSRTKTDSEGDTTLSKLVSRLLTILPATALCRAKSAKSLSDAVGLHCPNIRVIAGLASTVRGISELKYTMDLVNIYHEERMALVLMAENLLPVALQLSAQDSSNSGNARTSSLTLTVNVALPQYISTVSDVLDDMASYVNSVACCAGRISQENGFAYTQRLSDYLISLFTPCSASIKLSAVERQAFGYVGLQSALLFAKDNPSTTNFDYAEKIGRFAHHQGLDADSLSMRGRESHSRRFRWEDGISEWVAATPATRNKKRKFHPCCSSTATQTSEDTDCDSGTESCSHDTEVTSPESSSDQDELDELLKTRTGACASLEALARGVGKSRCRTIEAKRSTTSSQTSQKIRIIPRGLAYKMQGKGDLIRRAGEVESEDELSYT